MGSFDGTDFVSSFHASYWAQNVVGRSYSSVVTKLQIICQVICMISCVLMTFGILSEREPKFVEKMRLMTSVFGAEAYPPPNDPFSMRNSSSAVEPGPPHRRRTAAAGFGTSRTSGRLTISPRPPEPTLLHHKKLSSHVILDFAVSSDR